MRGVLREQREAVGSGRKEQGRDQVPDVPGVPLPFLLGPVRIDPEEHAGPPSTRYRDSQVRIPWLQAAMWTALVWRERCKHGQGPAYANPGVNPRTILLRPGIAELISALSVAADCR